MGEVFKPGFLDRRAFLGNIPYYIWMAPRIDTVMLGRGGGGGEIFFFPSLTFDLWCSIVKYMCVGASSMQCLSGTLVFTR